MKQRFAVFTEWRKPKIYKFPMNQTARLINEVPGRKVEIFETLSGARDAALALIKLAKENAKPSIGMFSNQPNPEDEELAKTLSELTEDRVEKYHF
jgi:hypothetical protein